MDPLFYEQVGQALRDEDPHRRAKAIVELARTGESGAIRMALAHARHETKTAILEHIGKMAGRAGADRWVELLRDELRVADTMEKCRILYVMQFLDSYDIRVLAAEQFGTEELAVRKAALRILNPLDKKTKLRIFKNLAMDRQKERRLRAIRGLRAFKHDDVVPILKRALKDSEYEVRRTAYDALVELKDAGVRTAGEVICKVPEPTPPEDVPVPEESVPPAEGENPEAGDGGSGARMTPIERNLKEGKTCRTCKHMLKERPDKKKMAPQRLWCNHLKKETLPGKTCLRGAW